METIESRFNRANDRITKEFDVTQLKLGKIKNENYFKKKYSDFKFKKATRKLLKILKQRGTYE